MAGRRIPIQLTHTVTYLGTIGFVQAISFLLLPIVTRFLEPEQYAAYAIALAFANLLGMFGTGWARNVAFRLFFDGASGQASRSFFVTMLVFQSVVIAALFSIAIVVTMVLPEPWVPPSTMLAAAAMMLAGDAFIVSLSLLKAERRAANAAAAEATAAVTRFAATLVGLLAGARSADFLFLAAAGAYAMGAVVSIPVLWRTLVGELTLDRSLVEQIARRFLTAMPFSVGEWLNNLSDRLILNFFSTGTVVGIYAAAHGLGTRLVGSLVAAVFMVTWPDILHSWRGGGAAGARSAARRQFTLFLWFTVGPIAALVLYADTIVLILGDEYRGAVEIAPLVGLAAWVRGFGNCFNRHFELQRRFWPMSVMTLGGAVVNVTLNLFLVPRYEALGAAVATLISQSLVMLGFVVTRDRTLVTIPYTEAGLVLATTATAGALCLWWLG